MLVVVVVVAPPPPLIYQKHRPATQSLPLTPLLFIPTRYIPDESMHCPDREFAATAYVKQAAPSGQPLSSIRYWDEGAASLMIKDLQPDAIAGKLCTDSIVDKKLVIDMHWGGTFAWTEISEKAYGLKFREACTSADIDVFKRDFFLVLAGCVASA